MEPPPAKTEDRQRHSAGLIVAAVVVLSWILVFARMIPGRDGDRGVFASMAERVAAGDRLYVDAWDNKEPLFYLVLGAGRVISPYADVVIEGLWIAAACLAAFLIARSFSIARLPAVLVAWGMTPLILTGGAYIAGFTHLPGTAILLGGYALALRHRWVAAGVLLPVLVGFKLVMAPVAISLACVELVAQRGGRRPIMSYAAGALGGSLAIALLLALRGELGGFLRLVGSNVGYSQSGVFDSYQWPVWKHIEPVFQNWTVATVASIIVVLAAARLWRRQGDVRLQQACLWSLLAATVVILLTGMWPHHGQIYYGPAILALVLLTTMIPRDLMLTPAALIVVLASTILLSGVPSARDTIDQVLSARARWTDLSRLSAATRDLRAAAPVGSTYARLGRNTDDSHAQGLRDYKLACYQFVQFPYDQPSRLTAIADCLPTAQFVMVDPSLSPEDGSPAWNSFVLQAQQVLGDHFSCSDRGWGQLCVNDANAVAGT